MTIVASDIDADDILTFSDDTELFDIDLNTGVISFVPTNDQVGIHLVTITVQDAEGEKDSETFTLSILNTNDAPVLSGIPDQNAKVGQRFTYTVSASDVDDFLLSFSDDSELFVINPVTGTITFIPKKGDEGEHIITITVADGQGGQDSQTMVLEIEGIPEESASEVDWLFLILFILIIILIWPFILYIMIRRKREREEEEPGTIEQPTETEPLPLFPEVENAPPPPPEFEDEQAPKPDFEEPPPPPPPY